MVLGMGWSRRSRRTGRGSHLGENAKQVQLAGRHQGSTSSGSEAVLRTLLIQTIRYVRGLICWLSWYPEGPRTRLYISSPCVCFCFCLLVRQGPRTSTPSSSRLEWQGTACSASESFTDFSPSSSPTLLALLARTHVRISSQICFRL